MRDAARRASVRQEDGEEAALEQQVVPLERQEVARHASRRTDRAASTARSRARRATPSSAATRQRRADDDPGDERAVGVEPPEQRRQVEAATRRPARAAVDEVARPAAGRGCRSARCTCTPSDSQAIERDQRQQPANSVPTAGPDPNDHGGQRRSFTSPRRRAGRGSGASPAIRSSARRAPRRAAPSRASPTARQRRRSARRAGKSSRRPVSTSSDARTDAASARQVVAALQQQHQLAAAGLVGQLAPATCHRREAALGHAHVRPADRARARRTRPRR